MPCIAAAAPLLFVHAQTMRQHQQMARGRGCRQGIRQRTFMRAEFRLDGQRVSGRMQVIAADPVECRQPGQAACIDRRLLRCKPVLSRAQTLQPPQRSLRTRADQGMSAAHQRVDASGKPATAVFRGAMGKAQRATH